MIVNSSGRFLNFDNISLAPVTSSVTGPWATFYTTASTPNPVQFITRMPSGESLFFDWGDGSAIEEVVGNGANQTTQHTYGTPTVGTEITISDDGGNRFLMQYFSIYAQWLSGDHPSFVDFSDITTVFLRDNDVTGTADFTGCSSLQHIYHRNCKITELTGIAGLSNLDDIYADLAGTLAGDIPSVTGCPDLTLASLYSQQLTGFAGGFTPASQRSGGFRLRANNNLLPSAEVNLILADARTADFGTGDQLDLDGNGNEAPTGQGLTDKQWLIDNGCTVNTN